MRTREERSRHDPEWSDEHRAARRQRVLEVVRESALPLRLEDIARAVTDRKRPLGSSAEEDAEDADNVRILLHHVDLPKLHTSGAIEYDPSRRLVS